MRRSRAIAALLALAASTTWSRARADEPPSTPPSTAEDASPTTRLEIEPPTTRPPWNGREAIWGGVGLIVTGVATLIVVAPALCTSGLFNSNPATVGATSGTDSRSTCFEATLGGGGGGAALGVILLVVGEMQRATYKEWLRAHPMFGGFSVSPGPAGPALSWSVSF